MSGLPHPCAACAGGRHDCCSDCTCSAADHTLPRWVLRNSPAATRPVHDIHVDDPRGDDY